MIVMMMRRRLVRSIAFLMLAHLGVVYGVATCNAADATCNEGGHVLLQKAFRAGQKTTLLQEPTKTMASTCNTTSEGKCWYLSELGETCEVTCTRYGMNFSYVLAKEEDPVTPALVNHIP